MLFIAEGLDEGDCTAVASCDEEPDIINYIVFLLTLAFLFVCYTELFVHGIVDITGLHCTL